jgi:uncharacterized protein (TIGR03118 family)
LDTNLANPWGLARSSGSPWWVANNGTGTSTLYNGSGTPQPLVVTVPPAPGSSEGGVPTGLVFNGTSDFVLPSGSPARFIFVGEDGTISGWNGGSDAVIVAKDPKAVYKGAAIANFRGANYLYVTNFAKKRIEVFDTHFARVRSLARDDGDDDDDHGHGRKVPKSFSPFNVVNIGNSLYVTFAKVDPATFDDVVGPGLGFVEVFTPGGHLIRRLQHGDWLNAPWGVTLAPSDFGAFSHYLLVGQFGSGQIAAYNLETGKFAGLVRDPGDQVLAIEGLWALSFGNGANAGSATTLFFTAGIEDEAHGLFGTLAPIAAEQLLGNGQ